MHKLDLDAHASKHLAVHNSTDGIILLLFLQPPLNGMANSNK